jgi:hypothetical protein
MVTGVGAGIGDATVFCNQEPARQLTEAASSHEFPSFCTTSARVSAIRRQSVQISRCNLPRNPVRPVCLPVAVVLVVTIQPPQSVGECEATDLLALFDAILDG